MNRRSFIKNTTLGVAGLGVYPTFLSCVGSSRRFTNFVIIFVDDMGYGDMTRSGHPTIRTPNLDRMADGGVMMTQFYSASPVCSPSRAALLTGRYPVRNGVVRVLNPGDSVGIPGGEITLAELLKENGYATAAIGKWHLGHLPQYLPTNNGFDYYYGIPYSNDMDRAHKGEPPIPLMRNEAIIEQPCDQTTLTKRYTEESIKFIQQHAKEPFLLYLAHTMPHVPLYRSDEFRGRSKRGLYGDVIEEIDWSVGEILDVLEKQNLDRNTLVLFTSDNGPWTTKLQEGGSSGLLRGAKGSTWEGGVREPFIARFPGRLPEGTVSTEMGTTMDIFATCLALAGIGLPEDRPIDGEDLMPVLQGRSESPHDMFCYFWNDQLTAIRSGEYKLHFQKNIGGWTFVDCDPYELYDLEEDPSEQYDVAAQNRDVVSRLTKKAELFVSELHQLGENERLIDRLLGRQDKP